jgi:hypothetical protein
MESVMSSPPLDRKKRAEEIIAHPQGYAVCEGCESIVLREKNFCPVCLGYRFGYDQIRIRAVAALLGNRPQKYETVHWAEDDR